MPLALSLRDRLWAAAAVCRKVGGIFTQLALPQQFERPQCLTTGCYNEYMVSLAASEVAALSGICICRRLGQPDLPSIVS
jgi:hypothetical protein